MTESVLKHLFSPITIRGKTIKNRIMSTGHDTTIPTDSLPNDRLVAYHQARAEGGVGLIIVQVAGVGSVIACDALRSLANEFEPLRGLLIRH